MMCFTQWYVSFVNDYQHDFCNSNKITNCQSIVFWPFKSSKCLHDLSYTCTIRHVYLKFTIYVSDIVHPFNICRNSHRSDIKCTPDLPLSRHLLSSSHKNARALQKHKIKIIENRKMQTENFFGILISTRIDRIEKVFGYKKPTCNIKNTFGVQLFCSPFPIISSKLPSDRLWLFRRK